MNMYSICLQFVNKFLLNSGFRENDRLTARNPSASYCTYFLCKRVVNYINLTELIQFPAGTSALSFFVFFFFGGRWRFGKKSAFPNILQADIRPRPLLSLPKDTQSLRGQELRPSERGGTTKILIGLVKFALWGSNYCWQVLSHC